MLTEIVNKHYGKLNATDIDVLTYAMAHRSQVVEMGIEDLAKACFTSKSTIHRLVQKLGFTGYSDFKSYLKWELGSMGTGVDCRDRLEEVQRDVQQTCRSLKSSADVAAIAQAIADAKTVVLFGTGEAQRYCAREMQRSFTELGVYLYCTSATAELNMFSRMLGSQDLVVFVSLSGRTRGIEDALRTCRIRGVKTASITNLSANPLAEQCDFNAYAVSTPMMTPSGVEHTSFASYFLVIESIYAKYIEIADVSGDHEESESAE